MVLFTLSTILGMESIDTSLFDPDIRWNRIKPHIAAVKGWGALSCYLKLELITALLKGNQEAQEQKMRLLFAHDRMQEEIFTADDAEQYLGLPLLFKFKTVLFKFKTVSDLHEKYRKSKQYYGIETDSPEKKLSDFLYAEEGEGDDGGPLSQSWRIPCDLPLHKYGTAKEYYGSPDKIAFQRITERVEPLFLQREIKLLKEYRAEKLRAFMEQYVREPEVPKRSKTEQLRSFMKQYIGESKTQPRAERLRFMLKATTHFKPDAKVCER